MTYLSTTLEKPDGRQLIFNRAYEGLRAQGFIQSKQPVSHGPDGPHGPLGVTKCMYRHSTENLKCAIGHCIEDSEYSTEMEGAVVMTLKRLGIEEHSDHEFLRDLQKCHDSAKDPLNMRDNLVRFANENKLTVPA